MSLGIRVTCQKMTFSTEAWDGATATEETWALPTSGSAASFVILSKSLHLSGPQVPHF